MQGDFEQSQITVGCLQDGKAAGNQSIGPCARHQGEAVMGTQGSRAVVALSRAVVALPSCCGGYSCSILGGLRLSPTQLVWHYCREYAAPRESGHCTIPCWCSECPTLRALRLSWAVWVVWGVMMKSSSARVPRSLFTLVAQAFVISFTSDFIPRLVYLYMYSENGTMHGFVNHTLSSFNVSDFQAGTAPNDPLDLGYEVQICRYSLEWSLTQSVSTAGRFWHSWGRLLVFSIPFLSTFYIRRIHCLEYLAYILSNHRPEYDLLLILGNGD